MTGPDETTPRRFVMRPSPRPAREPRARGRLWQNLRTPAPVRSTTPQQRRDVRNLLRGSIYEGVQPHPIPQEQQYTARQIVEFCLDVGEVMLGAGADARSVEVAIIAVAATWDLAGLEVEITAGTVNLQYTPLAGEPLMVLRVVRNELADLSKLTWTQEVVEDIVGGRMTMTEATDRLADIVSTPHRWPSWLINASVGVMGFSICLQAGGTTRAAALTLLALFGLYSLGDVLFRRGVPHFYVAGAQSALTLTTGSVLAWQSVLSFGGAAAFTAACLVLLLPHPVIATWAQEAITGFRTTANAKALGIGLVVAGTGGGVLAGLSVSRYLHLEVDPTAIHLTPLPWYLAIVATTVAAVANSVAFGSAARVIPLTVMASLVALAVVRTLTSVGAGLGVSTFAAATVLGIITTTVAARLRAPAQVIAIPAFCGALLPAIALSQSIISLQARSDDAAWSSIGAWLATLSIGAGLTLGNLIATGGARRYLTRTRIRSMEADTAPEQRTH